MHGTKPHPADDRSPAETGRSLAFLLLTSALLVGCAHQQAPAPVNGDTRTDEGEEEIVTAVGPEAATDAAITHAVRHELRSRDCVWDNNIDIESSEAVVTLRGEVLSWRAYQAAVDNAHEAGAEHVISRLRLRRPPIEPLPAGPPQEASR